MCALVTGVQTCALPIYPKCRRMDLGPTSSGEGWRVSCSAMSERRIHVAVIDDDPSVRRALQRVLKVMDVSVESYASGEEFLASLQQQKPDCVVLDLHMPGMSGLEVQEQQIGRAHV